MEDTPEKVVQDYLGICQEEPMENQKQLQRRKLMNLLWEHSRVRVELGEGGETVPRNLHKDDQRDSVNCAF